MFGYGDELNKVIQAKLADGMTCMQMSLCRSQALPDPFPLGGLL